MTALSVAAPRPRRRPARRLLVRADHVILDAAISILLASIERLMRRRI